MSETESSQSHAARRSFFRTAGLRTALTLTLGISWASMTACSSPGPRKPLDTAAIAQQRLLDADHARLKVVITQPGILTTGGGVWLGNGLVLTAMHLFRGLKAGDSVSIIIHGEKLRAAPVYPGDLPYDDLALLRVPLASLPDDLRSLPGPQICTRNEEPGDSLHVVGYDTSYNTYASPEGQVSYRHHTWSNSTTTLFSHGVSGSPVYDQDNGCLAGIVSKFESVPSTNAGEHGYEKCIQAIRLLREGPPDVTCAVTERTVFSPAKRIASFLTQAQAALRKHENTQ